MFKILPPLLFTFCLLNLGCDEPVESLDIKIQPHDHIVMIGNNLCSRMMDFGDFETEMHLRFPHDSLVIRNMCDGGDTPGFRPHSGRFSPWAFPGAEKFQTELANFSNSQGHFETPDQWLSRLEADIILAFFGYNESFNGADGIDNFMAELSAFVDHTLSQEYNSLSPPQLILFSPIAFENLSDLYDIPDGEIENQNLLLYSEAIHKVAIEKGVPFIDLYHPSKKWYTGSNPLTIDGFQLNAFGYQKLGTYIAEVVFGAQKKSNYKNLVKEAVLEKNWHWHDDYKSPNGVHVFGRRYNPFGPDNYPDEIKKKREMIAIRDRAIWMAVNGEKLDLERADAKTHQLPPVPTNYKVGDYGRGKAAYLYGDDALASLQVAEGYHIELFASEEEFPDLANPVQMSFDNAGRLWVAVMPTYPHYKPGDPKPNDKLIILEDTDGDHKADKQTIYADGLHIPAGFEFAPEGVYISQGTHLKLYKDTNKDDRADEVEIVMSGFDDHDTHHVISAFCADPSGAIMMGEGVFLHTNVETPYGPVRATNGGFYRYNPQRRHLERTSQVPIPNPWGIAFDEWGQNLFAETSGPDIRWMLPGEVQSRYGQSNTQGPSLVREEDKVRPTSGLEFVSSRHFPDDVQGDLLVNNTIGFLGMRQHQYIEHGTGYKLKRRHDLVVGTDENFRPVDMEFAPDGSLYFIDWHNVLIGHMQHNARDPLRDHVHGRVYRITYPSRPLVEPAQIINADIPTLLDHLKLPEYRTRYRTRRELRSRNKKEVIQELSNWINTLDENHPDYEHHLLEGVWVSWGLNEINAKGLQKLLKAKDHRARAAAVRVLRYSKHQIDNYQSLLQGAIRDDHGRVRLEAIIAASWLSPDEGLKVLESLDTTHLDVWSKPAYDRTIAHLNGHNLEIKKKEIKTHLKGEDKQAYLLGKELYERESYCGTCHQEQGQGLAASGYPPLRQSKWVTENKERLIKLTLKGLYGPMTVLNRQYKGIVPMTPFEGLMNDQEVAAVLTYVRNSFGNRASVVTQQEVAQVRARISSKEGFYIAKELYKTHPHENDKEGNLANLIPELE